MMKDSAIARREMIKITATIITAGPAMIASMSALADEQEKHSQQQPSLFQVRDSTTLIDVPLEPGVTLTVERRGQFVLLGLNRPDKQNRIDPDTFKALAKAIYDYDHDASLRVAILFGHGENFSRGIDVEAYRAAASNGSPLAGLTHAINPLNYGVQRTKPLIVAVHGDTWNLAHELFLAADIRVAARNTDFGQDENTHGRFPGGGSTVRFVHEAGWGNAMHYMLTGDHWSAEEAYRMGTLQEIAETPQNALARALIIAAKISSCGPLGIETTLASAHLAIDAGEAQAFANLGAQYSALYRTEDFTEGVKAQAEGREPLFQGK